MIQLWMIWVSVFTVAAVALIAMRTLEVEDHQFYPVLIVIVIGSIIAVIGAFCYGLAMS